MGYSFIKYLESTGYNRKLFYLDNGEGDLPVIVDRNDIQVGSEAQDLSTGSKWVLDSEYKWIPVPADSGGGSSFDDVPPLPTGQKYTRESTGTAKGKWVIATAASDPSVDNFVAGKTYAKNVLIAHEGALYRAKVAFVSGAAFVAADWEPFSAEATSAPVADFAANTAYKKNGTIAYKDRMYRAKADFTSGAAFDPTQWEEVSKGLLGMTLAEFEKIPVADRLDYTVITDSIFDSKV